MKKTVLMGVIIYAAACNQPLRQEKERPGITVINKAKSISLERPIVKPHPVSVYVKPITGQALQGEFGVRIYETAHTFDYLMKISYAELKVSDTLTLPNLGTTPEPDVRSGEAPNSCIVGFYDQQHVFKEYKLVQVKNGKLSIKALKHYAVATYRAQ